MTSSAVAASAVVLLTIGLVPVPIAAEPVTLTSGSVQVSVSINSARIFLTGDDFMLRTGTADFFTELAEMVFPTGSSVSLGGVWRPTDLRGGDALVNGVSYEDILFGHSSSAGTFETRPVTLSGDGLVTMVVPFTFTGFVTGLPEGACCGAVDPLFSTNLIGHGFARAAFMMFPDLGFVSPVNLPGTDYHLEYIFTAQPIPEPATLLLVGGGALAMVGRRWCLRRRGRIPG